MTNHRPNADAPRRRAGARARRALTVAHRWLGGALCILLLSWFVSGGVMMFAGFPKWSRDEQLATSAPLHARTLVPFAQLAQAGPLECARLSMLGARPAWRLCTADGERAFFADDGAPVPAQRAGDAAAEVARRFGARVGATRATRVEVADQWTVYPSMRRQLPAWRFELGDGDGTQVYVAERTGAIVQQTTRRERVLAWLGPIPHWIYPALLVRQRALWSATVVWLALLGLFACVLGLILGVLSWRVRGARAPLGESPFGNRWMRWHHALGLIAGVFACTWAFSGALSLSPFDWSPGPWPSGEEQARLAGGALNPRVFGDVRAALDACARRGSAPREIEAVQLDGAGYYVCSWSSAETALVHAGATETLRELPAAAIAAAVRHGWPGQRIAAIERTASADAYHYPTHAEPAFRPYVRIRFADAEHTALYVDPFRAELLLRHVERTRLERWLYHGLHSWDFPWLYRHRALWYALVLALLAGGAALSVTGVVVTLRWLRRVRARRARQRASEPTQPPSREADDVASFR
jgi:hypothetical protein